MSVLKRIFLVTLFIICISFSFCYAIDENQLTSGSTNSEQTIDNTMSINTENTIGTTENTVNTVENNLSTGTIQSSYENTSATSSRSSVQSSTDNQDSTRVSNVSSASNKSTIANILNIALLVVGVLLIFLAIAILIRLNS